LNRTHAVKFVSAALIASALCTVLATRVFVTFDRQRVKLVRTPVAAEQGLVRVETAHDPRAAVLAAPVAVIAVIRNNGATPAELSIVADGQPVCTVSIKAEDAERVDCAALNGWVPRADHVIEVTGESSTWSLESLELATHHGSTSRGVPLLILPEAHSTYDRPGLKVVVVAWLLIFGGFLLPGATTWRPAAVRMHRVLSGVLIVLLVAAAVSHWWSPFLLVISLSGFVKVSLVFLARRLWPLGPKVTGAVRGVFVTRPHWRPMAVALSVAVIVALMTAAFVRHTVSEFDGNFSGLFRVSEAGFDRSPLFEGRGDVRASLVLQPDEGYDGQFMYFALFDPFVRRFRSTPEQYRAVADAAPYRFGRIGYPWLVRAIAGGRWQLYPAAMVGVVLTGIVLSAFVLARLAQSVGASGLWGLIVLAIPGFWQSATSILPEPVAAAFLLSGYWFVTRGRIVLAIAAFAIALLVRETGVIFLIALAAFGAASGVGRRERLWLLSALVPVVAWRVYLAVGLWPVWGWDGLFYPAPTLTTPFVGLAGLWTVLSRGDYHAHVPELARASGWLSVLLIAIAVLSVALLKKGGRFIGAAFMAYALMSLSFTYPTVWGHPGNAQRASFELFMMFALASLGFRQFPRYLQVAIAACWAGSVIFILYGAHDAFVIWDALLSWS